jgi:uncharacterized protein YqhQ
MEEKITIGGQALIEGVMMRSNDKYVMAVRRPDKKISTKIVKINNTSFFNKIPLIRGCTRFIETLSIGLEGILYSSSESAGEEEKLNPWEVFFTIASSIVMTVLLFYFAPLLVARLFTSSNGLLFNLVDGLARLFIFIIYLMIISLMPDIRRIFQYHGAEHMTVHCYEKKEKLTIKNIRKYSTLHPRCGTNFIMIVFIVSIFFFSFIPVKTFIYKLGMRLLLLPLIAGISYEFLKLAGKYYENPIVKVLNYPGIALQMITTKKPEDDMIEVAIKSLNTAVKN